MVPDQEFPRNCFPFSAAATRIFCNCCWKAFNVCTHCFDKSKATKEVVYAHLLRVLQHWYSWTSNSVLSVNETPALQLRASYDEWGSKQSCPRLSYKLIFTLVWAALAELWPKFMKKECCGPCTRIYVLLHWF